MCVFVEVLGGCVEGVWRRPREILSWASRQCCLVQESLFLTIKLCCMWKHKIFCCKHLYSIHRERETYQILGAVSKLWDCE